MSVKWLIEPEVFQDDQQGFLDALRDLNIEHKAVKFGVAYEDYYKQFKEEDCVVFSGSLQFAKRINRETKWIPGAYCNLPQFECLYYYPRFGEFLLNHDYVMLPFGELLRRKKFLFETIGESGCLFLRPSSGFKTFTGFVVHEDEFAKELKYLPLDAEALVIASRPVNLGREWRTVVVNNKIIAASQYKEGRNFDRIAEVPQVVLDYGQHVLDSIKYQPDPVWILDLCETKSEEIKVLEVGSFSCSGLYACDPVAVITAVNEVALAEWSEYQ